MNSDLSQVPFPSLPPSSQVKFLQELIGSSPSLIAGLDCRLRFIAHSRKYLSLFHLDHEDLIGRHVTEVFPNIEQEWLLDLERCLEGRKIGPKTVETGTGTGRREELLRSLTPFRDETGKVTAVIIVNEVVTPRERLENDLRESELRYRTLADATFEAVFISENGVCIDTNARASEMFGYSDGEIIGMDITSLLAERDREMVSNRMHTGYTAPYEILCRRKDATNFQAMIRGRDINYLGTSRRVQVTVVRDIQQEKRVLQKLQESEKRYRDLVENINDAIYSIAPDGTVRYVSPVISSILGFTQEEIIGKSFLEKVHPDERGFMLEKFAEKKLAPGLPTECRLLHRDGGYRWVRVSTKPIFVDGVVVEMSGVLTDISREKEIEEQRTQLEKQLQQARRMEAIGTLAGGIAHDLNNILSGIVSYPDLLLMNMEPTDPARGPLETIQRSGKLAAAIVQDMLTLSRQNIQQMRLEEINSIITDYLESSEFQVLKAQHPGIGIDFQSDEDLPSIKCSRPHFQKILMNLVVNGFEAMEDTGILTIRTGRKTLSKERIGCNGTAPPGDYLQITVQDQGKGMNGLEMEKIFEPFFTTKKLGRSGTGLGMAVVWSSVENHGGYIFLSSSPGTGTTVELLFPAESCARPRQHSEGDPDIREIRGNGETILLVDDLEEQRHIGANILESLGYIPITASSGEQAIEYLSTNTADCVVLDMIMEPGLDGLDTYRKILDINPLQKVIIASGFAETSRVRLAMRLGIQGYLQKPYSVRDIGLALKKTLGTS